MKNRGMALLYIIGLAFIIGILFIGFNFFKSSKIAITTFTGGLYIAECAAEAGLNCVIAEMRSKYGWATHESDNNYNFTNGLSPDINAKSISDLYIKYDNGYYGKIGVAEFRVKVAKIKTKDNPNTYETNEGNIIYKIVSLGKTKLSNGKEIVRKIIAYVKEDSLNKYIMFDGEELNLCYGVSTGDNTEPNILSIGKIYAGKYLCLGTITGDRPELILHNISDISTGSEGRIFISSDGNVTIKNDKPYINFKIGGQWKRFSTVAMEPDKTIDPNNVLKGIMKDMYTGGKNISLVNDPAIQLKKLAEDRGIYIKKSEGTTTIHNYSTGEDIEGVKVIDFKDMLIGSGIGSGDDSTAIGHTINSNFNGIIYAECPLMLMGSPDQDLTIYSEKDIYISGDFNQRQNQEGPYEPVEQNYTDINLIHYKKAVNNNSKYIKENLSYRDSHHINQAPYWQNVDIIARGRVWLDFSDPKKFLKNELLPLIEYEIVEILSRDMSLPANDINKPQQSSKILSYENVLRNPTNITADEFKNRGLDHIAYFGTYETAAINLLSEYFEKILMLSRENSTDLIDRIKIELTTNYQISHDFIQVLSKDIFDLLTDDAFKINPKPGTVLGSAPKNRLGLPARLYLLTRKNGEYSQFKEPKYAEDRLYWPEFTINAKIKSFSKRNARWASRPDLVNMDNYNTIPTNWPSNAHIEGGKAINTIKAIMVIRTEMGNSNGHPYTFLPANTLIQRLYGGEAYTRSGKIPDSKAMGHYKPCLRKKVFDPNCYTPYELRVYNILSYEIIPANINDWNTF